MKKIFIPTTIFVLIGIFVPVGISNAADDLQITCEVSDESVDEREQIRFEVDIKGGDSPFKIDWDFDDGESSDDRVVNHRFDDEGNYRVEVTVEDDSGETDTDVCPLIRVSDRDNNNDDEEDEEDRNDYINVISSSNTVNTRYFDAPSNFVARPNQLASINSVFLSQVPYTGAEDFLFVFGVIALVLVWSVIAGMWLQKRRFLKTASLKINQFKEINRANKNIS